MKVEVQVAIPRGSQGLKEYLTKILSTGWQHCEIVINEADVERAKVQSVTGLGNEGNEGVVIWEGVQHEIGRAEREWRAGNSTDVNETASRLVKEATDSELVDGEDLIESEDLKRQFREAKKRLAEPGSP